MLRFYSSRFVTMWFPENGDFSIAPGRWVMLGGGNFWVDSINYLFSGVFLIYSFKNRITAPINDLPGKLVFPPQWWKGILGERIIAEKDR